MLLTKPRPVLAPQRSEEWREARRGNVTGSDSSKTFVNFSDTAINAAIRAITGRSKIDANYKLSTEYIYYTQEKDPFELFEEANMDIPETEERKKYRKTIVANRIYPQAWESDRFVNNAMKWGTVSEYAAIARYQMEKGINVAEAPFFLHQTIDTVTGEVEQLRCGASPDGLIEDPTRPEGMQEGVIEIKCLIPENHLYDVIMSNDVPVKYLPQIQMEMWITGRSFCDFIGFDSRAPEGLKILMKRIERDDKYIDEELEPSVRRFLDECDKDERFFRSKIRKRQELVKEVNAIYA